METLVGVIEPFMYVYEVKLGNFLWFLWATNSRGFSVVVSVIAETVGEKYKYSVAVITGDIRCYLRGKLLTYKRASCTVDAVARSGFHRTSFSSIAAKLIIPC